MEELKSFKNMKPGLDYSVFASILKYDYDEKEKNSTHPIILTCKIEETGIFFKAITWDKALLEQIKSITENKNICSFIVFGKLYKDKIDIRLKSLSITDRFEKPKVDEDNNVINNSYEIYEPVISQYIENIRNANYKQILTYLITNNKKFYEWRASKRMHHGFPGGLAKHSLNVCYSAINIANQYIQEPSIKIDYDLLVTGALLHDIGKLDEYLESGDFSIKGNLISHMIIGIEMINDACIELGIDRNSFEILQLKHIIASHHGKLEFGATNLPATIEANIISIADNSDAKIQAISENLEFVNSGESTEPMRQLDGARIFKFYESEKL